MNLSSNRYWNANIVNIWRIGRFYCQYNPIFTEQHYCFVLVSWLALPRNIKKVSFFLSKVFFFFNKIFFMWESFSWMISKWCQYGNRFFCKLAITCPNGMSCVWDDRTYCIRQNTDSEDLKLLFLFIFLLLLLLLLSKSIKTVFVASRREDGNC